MIGDITSLTTFDRQIKPSYTIYIPLIFWFNKFNGLAFPLIALQYNDLVFMIKLKKMSECSYMERLVDSNGNELFISLDDIWSYGGYSLDGKMVLDYVFLDQAERRKFAQSAHEYLIEVVQKNTLKRISQTKVQIELDFRHPTKEIIWIAQKDKLNDGDSSYTKVYPTLYSLNIDGTGNPFLNTSISFNGYPRVLKTESNYFNYYQPYLRHKHTPGDGINVYSFSIYPEKHQPSGTCNFSKLTNSLISFEINPKMLYYNLSDVRPDIVAGSVDDIQYSTEITIYIFALSYNILRVIGGFGRLAYS
jgi:hypothetical protein